MTDYTVKCPECYRKFDLLNEADSELWSIGHDCEPEGSNEPAPNNRDEVVKMLAACAGGRLTDCCRAAVNLVGNVWDNTAVILCKACGSEVQFAEGEVK